MCLHQHQTVPIVTSNCWRVSTDWRTDARLQLPAAQDKQRPYGAYQNAPQGSLTCSDSLCGGAAIANCQLLVVACSPLLLSGWQYPAVDRSTGASSHHLHRSSSWPCADERLAGEPWSRITHSPLATFSLPLPLFGCLFPCLSICGYLKISPGTLSRNTFLYDPSSRLSYKLPPTGAHVPLLNSLHFLDLLNTTDYFAVSCWTTWTRAFSPLASTSINGKLYSSNSQRIHWCIPGFFAIVKFPLWSSTIDSFFLTSALFPVNFFIFFIIVYFSILFCFSEFFPSTFSFFFLAKNLHPIYSSQTDGSHE